VEDNCGASDGRLIRIDSGFDCLLLTLRRAAYASFAGRGENMSTRSSVGKAERRSRSDVRSSWFCGPVSGADVEAIDLGAAPGAHVAMTEVAGACR